MMYFADSFGVSLFQLFARAIPLLIFSLLFFGIIPSVTTISLLVYTSIYHVFFIIYNVWIYDFFLAFFFTEVF